jgi:hypothetical protein
MARRLTADQCMKVSEQVTDMMLKVFKYPTRKGAMKIYGEEDHARWCAQLDLKVFQILNGYMEELNDQDRREFGPDGTGIKIRLHPNYGPAPSLRREQWGSLKPPGAEDQ